MKLLQELLSLRTLSEEAIETLLASDVWKDNKDSAKNYIPQGTFMVKKVKGSDPTEYEVYSDASGTRKLVAKMDAEELEGSYVPVRSGQKEDAEGFTVYRAAEDVEAFKYSGDTIKVDLEGSTKTLNKGDYLIRQTEDDEFTYDVQAASDFEDAFAEKK